MRRLILGFLVRFTLIFGLCLIPWPGWNALYGEGFRLLGNACFGLDYGKWVIYFEPYERTKGINSIDSQIVLSNHTLIDSQGHGRVRLLGIGSRTIGWIPTALTMALILASPVPWRRRGWALLWGVLLIHLFIVFSMAVYIWNQSTLLDLLTLPPFLKVISEALEYTLVTQIGAGFCVPVLIWIAVTFRGGELSMLISESSPTRKDQ